MIKSAIPVIAVSNAAKAEDYYCRVLGFQRTFAYRSDPAKSDPCYMGVSRNGIVLHLHSFKPERAGSTDAFLWVENVDALFAEFSSQGATCRLRPTDQTWGNREMGICDPDGRIGLCDDSLMTGFIMRILLLSLLLTVIGCRSYTPEEMKMRSAKFFIFEERHAPKWLKLHLTPGMTHAQVRALFQREPISSYQVENSWATPADTKKRSTFATVRTFEWLHDKNVQRCDVFQSPALHSSFQLLPDVDYLFFDEADKLVGFHHEMTRD